MIEFKSHTRLRRQGVLNVSKKIVQALAAALLFTGGAAAEDIDLFVKQVPASERPNVLIILDNTANWNQAFANEKSALVSAIEALPVDRFNVGLMMFTESGNNNSGDKGAYVRAAVRPIDAYTQPRYEELFASLSNTDPKSDKGDQALFALAMAEAHRYFAGLAGYAGHDKQKRDYAGNRVQDYEKSNAVYALAGNAFSSDTSTTYTSPIREGCQQNFIIFISNGPPDQSDNTGASADLLKTAGGDAAAVAIPLTPDTFQSNASDEWARFLANSDVNAAVGGVQTVKTYTLDIDPTTSTTGQGNTALLRSMAKRGKGAYFAASSQDGGKQVVDALLKIFSEVQPIDSAFASATLPVSVNAQGTYLNQVFIGMFRPSGTPRWAGNLKQYQFRADANAAGEVVDLTLADSRNNAAISAATGFISSCAVSYWSTADQYWPADYDYLGTCIQDPPADKQSNSPDGEIVEKGAAAQRLRDNGPAARNVKTCASCADGDTLVDFSTGTASVGELGVTDAIQQAALVSWARGQNVDNELNKGIPVIRPSVHGDVVHSRPIAIDYGSTTGVVVFYGGNDGMLRAINGNKTTSDAGNELWSFIAPDHYGKLKRLRSNSPVISFPGAPDTATPKDYFFDGSIGAYRTDREVWIYASMRRGGKGVYAFDVTDPANPVFKWKRDDGDLPNVGQTWSEPKVIKVAGSTSPILVMGGGYDPCEDQDAAPNTACGTSPDGNRIFVLNADTGQVLQTLGTDIISRSVAADVTPVDTDADGFVNHLYAVDTGGNVYRVNIGATAPGTWTVDQIATLGCSGSAACARKFLHAPEVVALSGYNAVLVGSGNRERPLLDNAATLVDNAFFMIKDDLSADPDPITTSALVAIDPEAAALTSAQKQALASTANKGWYLDFSRQPYDDDDAHDKEQVVTSAVVIAGAVYFSTHTPTPPLACGANLGLARGYALNIFDGSPAGGTTRHTEFAGGGLPPSPVAGVVTVNLTNPDGTTQTGSDGKPVTADVPFVIGAGRSGIDPKKVDVNPSGVRTRAYWYIEQ